MFNPRLSAAAILLAGAGLASAESPPPEVDPPPPSRDTATVVVVEVAPTGVAETTPAPAAACDSCGMSGGFDWAKHPRPDVFPRPGEFTVPGSGQGYYSAKDFVTGNYRPKPPAFPYPPFALQGPSSFNNDYRYLDNPENTETDFFDVLKRMHPTPDTMLTIGGQHSVRYMNETDARLMKKNDDYALYRNRVYADFWYQDYFRFFGEVINAGSDGNTLPARAIDRNTADFLNLFVEVKTVEIAGTPVYVRAGRQELLYGSQRLVSTLDWAQTRRTFEGVKAYWHSDKVDVDAFWTHPVVIDDKQYDQQAGNVRFYGTWFQYRPKAGTVFDLYYLGLENDTRAKTPFSSAATAPRGGQDIHTFGSRLAGNEGRLLYDFEGAVQRGQVNGKDLEAYFWTAGLGWEFKCAPWRPQLWVVNDYASGTADPMGKKVQTFQQLFPFGHYYLGFVDAVGRQNINDLNVQLAAYPENWITLIAQFHHFTLAERRDFLYNAGGVTTRRSPTGAAGRDVGDELDLLVNLHLSQHSDLLFGYSKLFGGDFIKKTGPNVDPELAYVMYNFRW